MDICNAVVDNGLNKKAAFMCQCRETPLRMRCSII